MFKRVISMALILSLLAGVPFAPQAFAAGSSDVTIYDLMTEDLVDPVGIDNPNPVFSWKMKSATIGQKQTAYQLTVQTGGTTVWDSGKVESDVSVGIVYEGQPLTSSTEYTWSVKVWDKDGNVISSPTATFETALLEGMDADFISYCEAAGVTDYTIDLDFVITKGGVSPVFGATDSNNFIMWQVNASKNQIRPHFREGGTWVAYPGKSGSIYNVDAMDLNGAYAGLNNTHHLRIAVRGTTIETYMGADAENLMKIGTYTHTKTIPLGLVGVRQAKNEAGWFDNFTVTDKDGKVLYQNTFTDAASNDIVISAGAISDGWLKMDGSAEVVCLQKGSGNNLPAYRKSITVDENLVSAKLYTAGLGVYESYINGVRVGHKAADGSVSYEELKPGFTQRNKRQFYSAFDITWMLSSGENVLGGVVTDGWWKGVGSLFRGTETAYLAKLILTYADGTQEIINTDTTWKSAKAAAAQSSTGIYAGERYDASVDQSWMKPGFDDSTWNYAKVNTEFTGTLDAWDGVPIIVRQDLERTPQSITVYNGATGASDTAYGDIAVVGTYTDGDTIALAKGQTLLVNFGQNFAGWEYVEIEGAKGTVVTVEHGEWLNEAGGSMDRGNDGPGGSIYNANYRSASANTIYTMGGNGIEKYHPIFSFYGFQYIEITATADITIHKVRGQVVTSVHNDTATMETSNADVNQLLSNIRWGMYSNYLSVPTDCPQRNERHGWTGDTQVFSQAGTYLTYSKSFLEKFLQDMRDGQLESTGEDTGSYSDIAPFVHHYGSTSFGEAGWSDAGIIVPWYLYMMYGDRSVLEEHWDSMVTYLDVYLASTNGNGPVMGAGDHLSPEKLDYSFRPCLGVIYYAWDALLMVDMANALGKTAEAVHYQEVYESQKKLFQERYVLEDGRINRPEQSAYLFALYLDLLPNDESVAAVTEQLVSSIESNGDLMMTGFLGTSIVMNTLTKIGRNDIAYTLLLQHNYPSWLYSVDQGATTIWERWNTYTTAGGFGDVSMNSFNHYSYGAVAGWMYHTVAGISYDTEIPGFKNIVLQPALDARLDQVKSTYESVYGLIETESVINGGNWTYKATIPANTTATVKLPNQGKVLTVNGKDLTVLSLEADGIVYTGTVDGAATFNAVAGSFTFEASNAETQVDWSKPQYCQHCKKNVTWTAFNGTTAKGGHYYLADDYSMTSRMTFVNGSVCLHLNGKTLANTATSNISVLGASRTLNIMDHPENLGVVTAKGDGSTRGCAFVVVDTSVLNIYGGTFRPIDGYQTGRGGVLYAEKLGKINMYGGIVEGGNVADSAFKASGGNVFLNEGGVFTMYGGVIRNGNANSKNGGNVYVNGCAFTYPTTNGTSYTGGAAFIMHGGTLEGGNAANGGAIYADGSGKVEIHGGNILYNNADNIGGSIYVASGASLTIDEDSAKTVIKGGRASQGGNIALVGATATMDAGEISFGCATATANGGGNLHLSSNASFTMNQDAGKESIIAYGKCAGYYYGGNLYNYSGTFTMNDGKLYRGYAVPVSVDFAIKTNSVGSNICNRSAVYINGGYVGESVRGPSILNMSSGSMYVTGGNIAGTQQDGTKVHAIRVWDSGKLYISGGSFTGGQVYADKSAAVEVSGGDFSGDGIGFTLNSASKGNGTLKISGGTISKLILGDNCDSYTINVSLSEKPVIEAVEATIPVTVSGLKEGASITFTNATEGAIFGTGDSAKHIFSDNGFVPALIGTDLLWAQPKVVAVTDGAEMPYASLQLAVDSGSDYVKLTDNVTEDVVVTGEVYLDLNGKTLTGNVTGSGTLYGMDSATDKYSTESMGRITGTVSCKIEKQFKTDVSGKVRRYMAIADDNGYTFHRFWLGITHLNLKPGVDGVGYKAAFYGDEQVRDQVSGYGYSLRLGENGKKVSAGKDGSFVSGKTVTARLQNFDVTNYGETEIFGSVYLTLKDGGTIESSETSFTLRSLAEQIAATASSYTESQLSALRDMLAHFESTTSKWNIDGIM